MNKMSVDDLSDAEIRTMLLEFGCVVPPVTQTTRGILKKKLRNILENRGAASRHSLAAKYSSDDTDDDTRPVQEKKKKTPSRRQTMANPMPPPAASSTIVQSRTPAKKPGRPSRNLEVEFPVPERPSSKEKKLSAKGYSAREKDGLETGSDSDVADEPPRYPKLVKPAATPKKDKQVDTDFQPMIDLGHKTEVKRRTVHTIRDDKYSAPPFKANMSPIHNEKDPDILANYESPYLSEFTRRLSTQTSLNIPSGSKTNYKGTFLQRTSSILPDVKESDTNGHMGTLKSTYPSTSRYVSSSLDRNRDLVSRAYKTSAKTAEDPKNSQNMISMILVVVVALFFGVLAIAYLGLGGKSNSFPAIPADSIVPVCSDSSIPKVSPGVNCVIPENVNSVFQMLQKLHPMLIQRAVAAACENTKEPAFISDTEVVDIFASKNVEEHVIKEDLYSAQLLIMKNPKWGLALVEIGDNNYDYTESDSMDNVFIRRIENKVGIVIRNPELPMQCLIRQKIFMVFSVLLITGFGLLILIGIYKTIIWYMNKKKQTEREVFQLVSEIISKLELNYQNYVTASPGSNMEPYLAINHVRDNLIPPKDRKKLSTAWDAAVKFLDENESRIRREVQQVAGEEFHVWRWLPNNLNTSNASSPGSPRKTKVWQGQAFETQEGSVNSLSVSPTPCLKIRHMFDVEETVDDEYENTIKNAILEKCGEFVFILHIKVDRTSREGCVYMKCQSQESAGKAYRALHGSWFDGRLVTVKYLRLERYHERFPDSISYTIPLKPSNNKRLSMQSHWHSPIEAN